jgi:hypothetical protein
MIVCKTLDTCMNCAVKLCSWVLISELRSRTVTEWNMTGSMASRGTSGCQPCHKTSGQHEKNCQKFNDSKLRWCQIYPFPPKQCCCIMFSLRTCRTVYPLNNKSANTWWGLCVYRKNFPRVAWLDKKNMRSAGDTSRM